MTPEQVAFAAAVNDLVSGSDQPPSWRELAGVGVTGLLVPQRWGGLGGTAGDLVAVAGELGRHTLPGPVIETVAAVPVLLTGLGQEDLAGKWLPEIAAGRVAATMAAPPWVPFATWAAEVDLVLRAERDSVWTGRCDRPYASAEEGRQLIDVGRGRLVAEGPAATAAVRDAINVGALAAAAALLGAGRELLRISIGYARARTQFGRPIGAFPAVQHQLTDVAVGLEFAGPLLDAAATELERGDSWRPDNHQSPHHAATTQRGESRRPDNPQSPHNAATTQRGESRHPDNHQSPHHAATTQRGESWRSGSHQSPHGVASARRDGELAVSAAKVACGEAAHRAARTALQVHGAIGYTHEYGLGRLLTRVRTLRQAWGTPSQHRARVMSCLEEAR